MKVPFSLGILLAASPAFAAPAPAQLAGRILEVNFNGAMACGVICDEAGEWKPAVATPLVIQFPAAEGTCFHIQLDKPVPGEEDLWQPNKVSYAPQGEVAVVQVRGYMRNLVLTLNFDNPDRGRADLSWGMDESAWLARGATFRLRPAKINKARVELPTREEDVDEGALQTLDDGLGELVRELEQRKYPTAVERLYRKRLLTLLPQIMEGAPIDHSLSDSNGTTALHNACGLSHVEIVEWLIDHGADLNAKTAKGAGVDDCVGGPNAAAIRAILRKARQSAE
ncbi:MAG: ankyrin repeat domain-containing protein [Akkermansia sp.]|nr:ankyrin repeat domain-containing protein [Akkermansia sp.]